MAANAKDLCLVSPVHRSVVLARVDHAQAKLWELGVTERDVLERTHAGLLTEPSSVTPTEAEWVLRRLAELLGWDGAWPAPR